MPARERELSDLEKQIGLPDFWNDAPAAQRVMKRLSSLREDVAGWRSFTQHLEDLIELARLDDESLRAELEAEVAKLEDELAKRSFAAMLSGPYDEDSALLAIHAGAGGTDSQDWAAMLQRMYLRWAEKR
ncbi:MAG: PCRF domain-containing protein, partial [Bacteroidota bacterium]